jgi:hypothetical protein
MKSALSSGSNLVVRQQSPKSLSREELIHLLDNGFPYYSIETSCGTFAMPWTNKDRISTFILSRAVRYSNDSRIPIWMKDLDHETFLFIHRYIVYGTKMNLNTLCERLEVTTEEAWGYDTSICLEMASII